LVTAAEFDAVPKSHVAGTASGGVASRGAASGGVASGGAASSGAASAAQLSSGYSASAWQYASSAQRKPDGHEPPSPHAIAQAW
jgi:hypothetical protein